MNTELASLSPSLFDDATRLYALRVAGLASELMVVGFRAREALSDLYEYEVDLLCTDAHLELKRFIASQAALSLTLADGTRAVRSGYIREAARLDSDGGLAAYRIRLVPWLWLATQQRHNRVFQDKTVLQIFDEVAGAYAPRVAWRAAPEVDAFIAQPRVRSYTVQYRESDYAFLSRLLAEEGLGFCFRDTSGAEAPKPDGSQDADNGAEAQLGDTPLHELLIFADSAALPEDYSSLHQNGGRGIRFHRAASQEDQDGIQAFGAQRILQHATTTLASYDYKAKRVIGASVPTDHTYGGPNAPALESYDWVGTYAFADSAEAERAARLLREAAEARNKTWIGQASVRTFRPGTCFNLTESPLDEGKAGQDSDRRFLLTEVRSRGVNNLPRELSQRAQALLGSDEDTDLDATALSHGYSAHISAIRATVPWRPVLTDGNGARLNPRPTASGVHSAVVVGADGQIEASGAEEIHTDKLGRIKVRFPWQQSQDSQDHSSCWLRVASRYAGAGHGAQFTPRIGQEVLVGFLEEDIDRPIVLGALYNGQGEGASPPTPGGQSTANTNPNVFALARDGSASAQGNLAAGNSPAWHGQGAGDEAHRHSGALTGFKTQGFGGSGYNQLVFDDSANQLRVQLATSQAASQLNLGHLIHQADNYRGSFRGQGFELRTDAYGAIRAGRGLILSTYQGSAPDASPEPAGDFAAGQALLKQAGQLAERFSQAAATHQTVKFAAHEGASQAGQSVIDEQGAPLKALYTAASGMVAGSALEAALQDASAKNTAPSVSPSPSTGEGRGEGATKLPHFSDPLIGLAAKAGLGLVAGQSLQLANGETLTWGSGQDTNLAIGNQLHIHSGQALGMLAGAVAPGEANTGLKAVAAQGPIDLQAQSDTLAIQGRDQVDVLSANAHVDFAAAKSITLNVAGGASLTIADGNITFACPGTLTIHAGQKSFTGPTSLGYDMPEPSAADQFDRKFKLLDEISGQVVPDQPYRITRPDGSIIEGVTNALGETELAQSDAIAGLKLALLPKTRGY